MIRQVTEAATERGGREERKVKGRLILEEVVGRLGTGRRGEGRKLSCGTERRHFKNQF